MDDGVADLDDDSADDSSDDNESVAVTEEPIEGCRIPQEDIAIEVDTPDEKVESVEHGFALVSLRQEKNAGPSPVEISLRQVSPTTCEKHLNSPSWGSLYGLARRYGRLLTSVRRRDGVS